jgi:hypothetical protein
LTFGQEPVRWKWASAQARIFLFERRGRPCGLRLSPWEASKRAGPIEDAIVRQGGQVMEVACAVVFGQKSGKRAAGGQPAKAEAEGIVNGGPGLTNGMSDAAGILGGVAAGMFPV